MLVGDNNQLDPVSAGNTFNELITRHADRSYTTILSEISRQKLEASLGVASHVSGKVTMDALEGTDAHKLRQWQSLRLSGDHISMRSTNDVPQSKSVECSRCGKEADQRRSAGIFQGSSAS
ncbi:AAA family ATPase [Burkholderia glumae]|uniref:AAA family ATPase n=1 Tax=Burkholderia glumae TaxID=337 RepID=UPI003B984D22